ncbi:MAG: hypothetical protein UU24_C0008G0003 [Candidatus Nomurabacteria bacterium GW2011_GWA2_40_9]|uniref:Uncharacterized protein n=1 Tax=Candidatus Nomurabacteria bacterium GW2011_GWA2_40_9 TaxID=1618734 RepID=A0A0G0W5C6_9BACT|nr:MAG: hypothetical protein UU24_C0008G0003 [Candidatus Nomurabacteria bacterium GW2011_GWA2_40_9]
MQIKKFIISLFFVVFLFPIHAIIAETKPSETPASISVSQIKKNILEKTPEFISKLIIATVEMLENFRKTNGVLAKEKKQEFNQEVILLNTPKESTTTGSSSVADLSKFEIEKPFAYAKLFLMTILTLIFEQKVLFYGFLLILMATIFRFIWRKIF